MLAAVSCCPDPPCHTRPPKPAAYFYVLTLLAGFDILRPVPEPYAYVNLTNSFNVNLIQVDYDSSTFAVSVAAYQKFRPPEWPGQQLAVMMPQNTTTCRAKTYLHKPYCWTNRARNWWVEFVLVGGIPGTATFTSAGYISWVHNCTALQSYLIPLSCFLSQGQLKRAFFGSLHRYIPLP